MSLKIVSFGLHSPWRDYPELFSTVGKLGDLRYRQPSVLVLQTSQSHDSVTEKLWPHLFGDDTLLVAEIAGKVTTVRLPEYETNLLS